MITGHIVKHPFTISYTHISDDKISIFIFYRYICYHKYVGIRIIKHVLVYVLDIPIYL